MVLAAYVLAVAGILMIIFRVPGDKLLRRVGKWSLLASSRFVATARPGSVVAGGFGFIAVAVVLFVRAAG